MTIKNNIPETMVPGSYAEFNFYAGPNGLPTNVQKVLLVGAGLASASLAPATPLDIYSESDVLAAVGAGSVLHSMYLAAKSACKYTLITLVKHAEPTGTAATWAFSLSTAATKSGLVRCWIDATYVDASIVVGSTPALAAAALVAAINAKTQLPVTASATDDDITLTAKNVGSYISAAGGVAIKLESIGTDMVASSVTTTSGTGTVDVTQALASVFAERYHIIGLSVNDATNLGILRTHLENAAGPLEQRGQRGIAAFEGVATAAKALATGINHERMHIVATKALTNPVWEIAAGTCAVFASNSQPNKPMNGLPIVGLDIPAVAGRWNGEEMEALLYGGVIPLSTEDGELTIVRAVTTKTSKDGVRIETLVDTGVIASLDYVRDAIVAMHKVKYKNAVIHEHLPSAIKEDNIAVCNKLEEATILRNVDQYADDFLVEEDTDHPGRIKDSIPAHVVPGLNQIFTTINLYLN